MYFIMEECSVCSTSKVCKECIKSKAQSIKSIKFDIRSVEAIMADRPAPWLKDLVQWICVSCSDSSLSETSLLPELVPRSSNPLAGRDRISRLSHISRG